MGHHDVPNMSTVKLYCAKCEDTYNPKSSRHGSIDGAYFGSSFHNILFQVYPTLVPEKSIRRYEPRVFGFRVHASAALARWQDQFREEQRVRLRAVGVDIHFAEDSADDCEREDDEEEEEEAEDDQDGDERAAAEPTVIPGAVPVDAASARVNLGH